MVHHQVGDQRAGQAAGLGRRIGSREADSTRLLGSGRGAAAARLPRDRGGHRECEGGAAAPPDRGPVGGAGRPAVLALGRHRRRRGDGAAAARGRRGARGAANGRPPAGGVTGSGRDARRSRRRSVPRAAGGDRGSRAGAEGAGVHRPRRHCRLGAAGRVGAATAEGSVGRPTKNTAEQDEQPCPDSLDGNLRRIDPEYGFALRTR